MIFLLAVGTSVCGTYIASRNWHSNNSFPSAASIVVDVNVRDLGRTSVRSESVVPFVVHNAGKKRLVLNEVNQACDCGDSKAKTIVVVSGETAQVPVLLDTRFSTGSIENHAVYTTNDPNLPRLKLTARVFVVDTITDPLDSLFP